MLKKFINTISNKVDVRKSKKELGEVEKEESYPQNLDQKDPYVYKGTYVLKNKLGIKDGSILDRAEVDLTVHNLLNIDEKVKCEKGKFDADHLKKIHKHIFGDLYEWAGNPRVMNMYKDEEVLNGMSVQYSDYREIEKDLKKAIDSLNSVKWDKLSQEEIVKEFTPRIAQVWQTHAFREGNTRTTMTFACQYAEAHGFKMDREVFKENSRLIRDSLVVASIGEYSEYDSLGRRINEAIEKGKDHSINQLKEKHLSRLLDREKEILGFIQFKIQENPTIDNIEKLIGYAQGKIKEYNDTNTQQYKEDLKMFESGKKILEGVDRQVIKESFIKEVGINLDHTTTEKIRRLNQKDSTFHTYSSLKNYALGANEKVMDILKGISQVKSLTR